MKKFTAKVITGDGRGHEIGFPTINLDITNLDLNLDFGVYASRVSVNGKIYAGAMNYGPRPTFNKNLPAMEVHLLNFLGDLYNIEVEVEILGKIRDVEKFNSKEELIEQIKKDVEAVKKQF